MSGVSAGPGGGAVAVPAPTETTGFGTLIVPLLIGQALVTADFVCMNPMAGEIAKSLNSSLTGLQGTIALSYLVMGALIIPASRIGARRGSARMLAVGALVMAFGDAIAAVSPKLPVLFVGKALIAAAGAALIVPAVFSLATHHYGGGTRKRAFALINAQLGTGAIAGALLGGWLATKTSWRWWFVIEIVIALVLFVLMRPHFEEPRHPKVAEFDIAGSIVSFAGMALVVLGLVQASAFGFVNARQDFHLFGVKIFSKGGLSPTLPIIALGLLTLVLFGVIERRRAARGKDSLVDISVLKLPAIRNGTAALSLNFAIMGAGLYLIPVFGVTTLGWTATKAGLATAVSAIGLIIGCLLVSRALAAERLQPKTVALVGFPLIVVVSCALALAFSPSSGLALISSLAFVQGASVGFGMVSLSVIVQNAAPPDRTDDVSGLSREASYVFQSIGVALVGAVMIAVLVASLNSRINASSALDPAQKQAIVQKLDKNVEVSVVTDAQARAAAQKNGVEQAAIGEVVKINGSSRVKALTVAALVVAVLALIALVFTLLIPAPATRAEPRASD